MILKILLAILFTAVPSSAGEPCPALKGPGDVLACALINHPDARLARAEEAQVAALRSAAGQRPNPELTNQSVIGRDGGNRFEYAELNFAHTFELGGKRDARMAQSDARAQASGVERARVEDRVYLETRLALTRLRQLREEASYLDEALALYDRVAKQFRGRPRLTPEQEVSLGLFDMAANGLHLKRSTLGAEQVAVAHEFEHALGQPLPDDPALLPGKPKSWPTLATTGAPEASIDARMAVAGVALADAEEHAARGSAWPDLRFGPTIETQRIGSQRMTAFGTNLALVLPLYHRNAAGKEAAGLGQRRAALASEAALIEAVHSHEVLSARYKAAVSALEGSLTAGDIARRETRLTNLFEQGLVAAPLLLEAQRQRLDWISGQNEQERIALEALGRIRALDGRLLQEGL